MKTTIEQGNVIRIAYRQEKGDPKYGSCLWADFYLDAERGSLMIMSDCGEYGYRWPETGWEFIRLMESIGEDYLLHKLCKAGSVDVKKTIQNIRETMEEDETYSMRRINQYIGELMDKLNEYDLDNSPDLTSHLVSEWANDLDIDIPDIWEYVSVGFSAEQKRIAEIYVKHIRPLVREAAEGACVKGERPCGN